MENNNELKTGNKTFKEFIKSKHFLKSFLAIVIGALAGFLYYYFVGCQSGSCAITSNPFLSMLTGGFLGLFIVNSPCSRGKC
jgi:hypothetical protein